MGSGWVSCSSSSSSKRWVESSSPGWVDRPPLIDNRTICRPSCRTLLDWVSFSHCSTVRWQIPRGWHCQCQHNSLLARANAERKQCFKCTPSPFPISWASVTCCWLHVSRQRGNVGASICNLIPNCRVKCSGRPTDRPSTLTVAGTVAY